MAAILDHLTAILVGATLLVALLFVQHRGKQAAMEATVHHVAQAQTATFMEVLERDLDNVRVFDTFQPAVQQGGGRTTLLQFHTLADPALGAGSPIIAVTYRLEDTYRTMAVNGEARPVYRVARYANDGEGYVYDGGSATTVLDFDVALVSRDGASVVTNGPAPEDFARVTASVVAAIEGPARAAGDQAATAATNLSEQGGTFRPLALTSGLAPPAGTPPNPGASLPPSPFTPPARPPAEGGGGSNGGGSNGGGSSSGGGSPPPPPPPPPPEGEL